MAYILIIEDNLDFVDFASTVLDLNGHRVRHTASLWNGIALANQTPGPDLVLLDLDLPDGNGLAFFEQVASDLPVVVLTASTEAEVARQLQAQGARYVIKPISARDLIDLVKVTLTKGEIHDPATHPYRR